MNVFIIVIRYTNVSVYSIHIMKNKLFLIITIYYVSTYIKHRLWFYYYYNLILRIEYSSVVIF